METGALYFDWFSVIAGENGLAIVKIKYPCLQFVFASTYLVESLLKLLFMPVFCFPMFKVFGFFDHYALVNVVCEQPLIVKIKQNMAP